MGLLWFMAGMAAGVWVAFALIWRSDRRVQRADAARLRVELGDDLPDGIDVRDGRRHG